VTTFTSPPAWGPASPPSSAPPLAGALFAAEVMYRSPDFESEAIIPAALASIIAYCTFGMAFGWTPLFVLPDAVSRGLTFNNRCSSSPT
jgi:H+/Cl- antiporter ClcA